MRSLKLCVTFLLAAGLAACTRVDVGAHLTAADYTGTIRRMFVVNGLDPTFDRGYIASFATALSTRLASCHVETLIYRPNSMELDAEAKLRSRLNEFKPDSTLMIHEAVRYTMGDETRAGSYIFVLHDLATRRDVRKASIKVGSSASFLTDRKNAGSKIADRVVAQMSADGVLKTCPAPEPPAN